MAPTTAPPTTSTAPAPPPSKKNLPVLLPLEEDDEFEEFPAEDWKQENTYAHSLTLAAAAKGTGASGGVAMEKKSGLDTLWDDNWDDDDVTDDFSAQLRGEILKADQMQT